MDPVKAVVTDGMYNRLNGIEIKNCKQPKLPFTDREGTMLFTIAGVIMLGGAACFFILSKRQRKTGPSQRAKKHL